MDRKEYYKQYYQSHKEKKQKYWKEKYTDASRRASVLVAGYRRDDKEKYGGKEEDTISTDFLLNRLFPKGCCYCGEKDPLKLGADRIDNTKPHTKDNVVCSCWDCNNRRNLANFEDYFYERFMESILF